MIRRLHADERGVVASFLIKVILGLAVIGTVLIEGGSVLFNRLQVQDAAESAATAGAARFFLTGSCDSARDEAKITIHDKDAVANVKATECLPDGRFSVVVTKRANTLYLHRFDLFRHLTTATARVTAEPPQPDV